MNRSYRANRGGHAPGYLRDALERTFDIPVGEETDDPWYNHLEEGDQIFSDPKKVVKWNNLSPRERGKWLIGQLWNCTDIMPSMLCESLGVPQGSTYAMGVRALSSETGD